MALEVPGVADFDGKVMDEFSASRAQVLITELVLSTFQRYITLLNQGDLQDLRQETSSVIVNQVMLKNNLTSVKLPPKGVILL